MKPFSRRLRDDYAVRRARVILLVLVAGVVISGALRATQRDLTRTTSPTTSTTTPAPVATPASVIRVMFPSETPVRAHPGDLIELSVRSATPDIAKIVALGVSVPVGPGVPGTTTFRAGAPGDYAVTLDLAESDAGVLQIADAR
ncbi:unannotated protein [freshwater metagenome]|uniref:Unannotated protein n=1 Tax=freshwater metagenome TaxID=449393 RepID=A0A6J7EJU7_9ZZZZ|nr:hypothetical protein [Actinomycetota bacterium]